MGIDRGLTLDDVVRIVEVRGESRTATSRWRITLCCLKCFRHARRDLNSNKLVDDEASTGIVDDTRSCNDGRVWSRPARSDLARSRAAHQIDHFDVTSRHCQFQHQCQNTA
jgi:hypothetical protein